MLLIRWDWEVQCTCRDCVVRVAMGQALGMNKTSSEVATRSNLLYNWAEHRYESTLGVGAFGEVYKVRNVRTSCVYALKKIKCGSNVDLNNVTQELKCVCKLRHPNIMALHETCCKQRKDFSAEIYMIFEYCVNGTLGDRLQKPSSKEQDLNWMRQLTDAITYIHSHALVHRDLKPDNILLGRDDKIKVGDFGLARDFHAAKRKDETWANYYMSATCGTLFYMAPEVFEGHYTEKADVFALGLLLYAIEERQCFQINGLTCYGIFIRLSDGDFAPLGLQMHIDNTTCQVPFKKCDPKMAQIIGSTLLFDQKNRSDAQSVLQKLNDYATRYSNRL